MSKVAKLQQRLSAALNSKQFYEAHQILRTVHARLSAERRFTELLEQIQFTVLILCEAKEYTSAIDLAELYAETLKQSEATLNTENLQILLTMFSNLPSTFNSDSPSSDRRIPFLNKTLDWALKSAKGKPEMLRACALLQRKFGDVFFSEGQEEQAERYARSAEYLLDEADRIEGIPIGGEGSSGENLETDNADEAAQKIDSELELD
ncbi:hypothetical protein niasHT_007266 [Heterodera trifolii]|uniref:Uncharacterized protein n=1 Tax=Heterodera trifolii TaxID=157864 RepID=A0ABD2LL60_9BILA